MVHVGREAIKSSRAVHNSRVEKAASKRVDSEVPIRIERPGMKSTSSCLTLLSNNDRKAKNCAMRPEAQEKLKPIP